METISWLMRQSDFYHDEPPHEPIYQVLAGDRMLALELHEAEARLIAKAPELADALARCLDALARDGVAEEDEEVYQYGEHVLTKATRGD